MGSSTPLSKVTEKIGSGATPRGGNAVYGDFETSFIRSQNVYDYQFDDTDLAHIDDAAAKALEGVTVRSGDVLLNITGDSVARCCVVPDAVLPARVSQHVMIVRPRKGSVDARFLQAFLTSPGMKAHLLSLATAGATRPALTKSDVSNLLFPEVPLQQQKAVGNVLQAIDDKIQANARQITLLGSMVRALFLLAMEDPTVQLRPLPEVTRIVFGEPFKSSQFCEEGQGRPLIRIRDLKTFRPQVWTTESRSSETVVEPGDVIIGMDAEFRPTVWRGRPGLLNQRVCLARPTIGSRSLVRELLVDALAAVESFKSGTTVSHLNKSDLDNIRLPIPADRSREEFDRQAEPLREFLVALHAESDQLERLRDTLLPKLISGELRVRDAEDELEAVG
jgi:type I restriction enzyme, S subunit